MEQIVVSDGELLEGTTYDERNNTLYYIDIPLGAVYAWNLDDDATKKHIVGKSVGVIGLTSDVDVLICGIEDGVVLYNLSTGSSEYLDKYPDGNIVDGYELRSNDGSISPNGTFYVGTMDLEEKTMNGSMWMLNSKKLVKLWDGCGIPNGINWDTTRNVVYWTDSTTGSVYKYKYDGDVIDVSSKESFFVSDKGQAPDGSCLDSEGNLYVCIWGGSKIVKISHTGDIVDTIAVPSENVTCCAFGGKDFSTLYITTAKSDVPAGVYKIDLNVKGLPKNKYLL